MNKTTVIELLKKITKIELEVNSLKEILILHLHEDGLCELPESNSNKNKISSSDNDILNDLKNGQKEIWAKISGTNGYYAASNYGRIMRIKKGQGTSVGTILHPFLNGSRKYKFQPDGSIICKDYRKPSVTLYYDGIMKTVGIHILIARAFVNTMVVKEDKIIPKSVDNIQEEKTRMIIEKIDKFKPATFDNLRINYIPRGIRHWNHKLSNELVLLVRSNLDMKFKDFMNIYEPIFPRVCLGTIRKLFRGESWRVRTEPIQPMTNPEENFPNGELCNWIDFERIYNPN